MVQLKVHFEMKLATIDNKLVFGAKIEWLRFEIIPTTIHSFQQFCFIDFSFQAMFFFFGYYQIKKEKQLVVVTHLLSLELCRLPIRIIKVFID